MCAAECFEGNAAHNGRIALRLEPGPSCNAVHAVHGGRAVRWGLVGETNSVSVCLHVRQHPSVEHRDSAVQLGVRSSLHSWGLTEKQRAMCFYFYNLLG